jgi:hypothetical protein
MNKKILVLGSKPNFRIPLIDFDKVYSSNASAEIAKKYQNKIKQIPHTCIVGAKNYIKINEIKKRIIRAKPDELVIRSFKNKYLDSFNNKIKKKFISNYDQLNLQSQFLKRGIFDLIYSELSYETILLNKIKYFIKCLVNNEFLGFSTGIFAALYALNENQNSQVFLSGIGLKGGSHYYGSGNMTLNRGKVDEKMFSKLKTEYLNNIIISDSDINVNFFLKIKKFEKYITINDL